MSGDMTTDAVVSLKANDELVIDEVLTGDPGEEEDEEEPEIGKTKSSLAWDSLFASVEEMDLDSAIDTAIKTLKNGKEVGKLSVIRTLTDLLDSDGDECIEKIFSLVQDVLAKESSNLDLHCEAAVVFKNIIKDKKWENRFSGLSEKLLNFILQNVENQRENGNSLVVSTTTNAPNSETTKVIFTASPASRFTAAAWLETLSEIADSIPIQTVVDLIVPLVVSQAEPTKRVQRRVIATRLLEKLCSIVPNDCVKKDLAPCAQMLCRDPSAAVRTSIAQRLSVIAESLKNSTDCVSLLLPCLIELCKDDDPGVREAILNTIAVCLPYFTKESRKSVVIPLLRKCTEQALFLKDTSLTVVAKQLGPWLDSLKEILSPQELKWFLDTYCRLVDISMRESDKVSPLLCTSCRRMCAYNFPCFAMVYEKEHFNERLMPILEKFCTDGDDEVRGTIASGFHEIVQMRPDEPALVGPFIELIRGGAPEVVQQMTEQLHKTLPPLYECIKKYTGTTNVKISRIQLDRIIIGCNRLLRGTGSWRSHESYLKNIACIRHLIPFHDLYISFLPMLKQEVLTARALPCRIAAAETLLLLMREFPMEKNRHTVVEFFTSTIGEHESCHRRRVLLDVVPFILQHFSREFFKKYFLGGVLKLAQDRISNIRIQLCRILPLIKQHLVFPDDESLILNLEKVIRERLTEEKNVFDRQLIQQYACELSRAETAKKDSKENKKKLAEEKKLWTEVEPATVESPDKVVVEEPPVAQKPPEKKITTRKPTTDLSKSAKPPSGATTSRSSDSSAERPPVGWRTTRPDKPKVAVVRPQPQIVITQRSPSPMPPKPEERKSKLPLATAKYRTPSNGNTATAVNNSHVKRSGTPVIDEQKLHKYRTASASAESRNLSSTISSSQSLNNGPSSGPSAGLRRSATTSSMNTGVMSRSATSYNSSSSSSASNNSSTSSSNGPHALMTSRSMSSIRRPYGLMKVQSSSAIERKPPSMSIRVVGMS